jgi:hypothetical protein
VDPSPTERGVTGWSENTIAPPVRIRSPTPRRAGSFEFATPQNWGVGETLVEPVGLWELGTKLGSSFFHNNDQKLKNCVEIFEDRLCFEPDHFVTIRLEVSDTTIIVFEFEVVVCSVNFDDKFEFGAEEVDAIVADGLLAAEFGAEFFFFEVAPEDAFWEACGFSEFSGELGFWWRVRHFLDFTRAG